MFEGPLRISPNIELMKRITILLPCYNEEGNLRVLNERLQEIIKMESLKSYEFDMMFVDDGSSDRTMDVLKEICDERSNSYYISLSRNFGHQNAIKAGIDKASSDAVIMMDADMQHPPELIEEMVQQWEKGFDVVNTVRMDGKNQGWWKRKTSRLFYRLVNVFSHVRIDAGAADFRLLDRTVVEVLQGWNEQNLFFRGIIPWLGFRQCKLKYRPEKRHHGDTKYTYRKMMSFALDGVTSFSIKPLRLSIFIGIFFSFISLLIALYAIYINVFTDRAVPGWTSVMVSTVFLGGLQLLMIGIIGEYLGKLFIENKKRPNYIIRETNVGEEEAA